MMKVNYIEGNVLDLLRSGQVDAIAHGCNCFHTMGAGIAATLNEATAGRLLEADLKSRYGDINKLGGFTSLEVTTSERLAYIYNMYTQYTVINRYQRGSTRGGEQVAVHWPSVTQSLCAVLLDLHDKGLTKLAIPHVGCGLAGGSFDQLCKLVIEPLQETFTFFDYDGDIELYVVAYDGS